MTATEYLLKLVVWQWFGTLTWANVDNSHQKRATDVEKFLRRYAAREQVSFLDLPLAIRWERGEQTQRPHCHFLLTGIPDSTRINRTRGYVLSSQWHRLHGLARIRPWESALRAEVAAYMGGVEPERVRRDSTANEYEMSKFHYADRLILNDALWAKLQCLTGTTFAVAPST